MPSLPLPQPPQTYSSSSSSPRVSSISSAASSHVGSQSSFTSATSSNGPKTPGTLSPNFPAGNSIPGQHGQPTTGYESYPAMNPPGSEMYYQPHMSQGPAPPPQTVTSHYGHPQPPLLQPVPAQYPTGSYSNQYGYGGALTSPPTGPPNVSNPMGGGPLPLPAVGGQPSMPPQSYQQGFDTTGQIAPPGMKPRVTATLWEDEGSLCFQVEARGICVARREGKHFQTNGCVTDRMLICSDNHMINGTKLLNVAGMTRGRRDGILKSEKVRHVVKIGPMHLKGVW